MPTPELKVNNLGFLEISQPRYRCPVCGEHSEGCLEINMKGHKAKYCLICYADWVRERFPELVEVEEGE